VWVKKLFELVTYKKPNFRSRFDNTFLPVYVLAIYATSLKQAYNSVFWYQKWFCLEKKEFLGLISTFTKFEDKRLKMVLKNMKKIFANMP